MTNHHCIKDEYDLRNSDFEFMAEDDDCTPSDGPERSFSRRNYGKIYDGITLLKASASWDYSLILLPDNSSAKFG